MKTLALVQGSPEWHQHRMNSRNASEAAAMLGQCKYKSRRELLKEKATGITEEVTPAKQRIFDSGHLAEGGARPIAEEIIGDELFPCTATDDEGYLSASYDGLTMLEEDAWEHKLWNKDLADAINRDEVPDTHWPQLEQQMLIAGIDRILFMCSDGTEKKMASTVYQSVPERRAQILAGWKQFDKDLENYEHVEDTPAPQAEAPKTLPAINIRVGGEVRESNLELYHERAMAIFGEINMEPKTDEEFVAAEKTFKWCEEVEQRLNQAKENVIGQTASIDEVFRTIDEISSKARDIRLKLSKAVEAEKDRRKAALVKETGEELAKYVSELEENLLQGKAKVPKSLTMINFAVSIKGKRSISKMRDALDADLAAAKIQANTTANLMRANLDVIDELTVDHGFLFTDSGSLLEKETEHLRLLIRTRISEYEQEQAAKAQQEESVKAEEPPPEPETTTEPPAPDMFEQQGEASAPASPITLNDELDDWAALYGVPHAAMGSLRSILLKHEIDLSNEAPKVAA